jgi:3-oxoacid CoA-transferase
LGVGGAMDLAKGAKKLIITMTHVNSDGSPKIVPACVLPLTASAVVKMIITDLAVFEYPNDVLTLTGILNGSSLEEIKEKTTAKFEINLK